MPFRRILDGVFVAALAALVLALAASVAPRALGFGTVAVMSGSMGRDAPTGSLVLGRWKAGGDVRTGDVIVARRDRSAPVLHRVISVGDENGRLVVRTKGDANPNADPEPYALPSRVLAKEYVVPLLGYLVAFVKAPMGFMLLIALPAIALAASSVYRVWTPAAEALETAVDVEPAPSVMHLRFVPGPRGYRLAEAHGEAPATGATVADDGVAYVVSKLACSPLPGDERACAYLLPC
jgi:signal peptidase I